MVDGHIPLGRWVCTVEEAEAQYIAGRGEPHEQIWADWKNFTSALRQVLGEIPACWLGGSLFTDKPDPGDIDCVYVIDATRLANPAIDSPQALNLLGAVLENRLKKEFNLRIDSFILPWIPTPGPIPTAQAEGYLQRRGYWDDFWSRIRDPNDRLSSIPRRGYLEVIIDGYS
ncbi:DUF6932 family protein [Actinomadura parmotrematis]|uniref:Polymerase nucleotidyl transferase domain-containing protein n=1 Tax=Actinomadura parmotrematis TaxID=2864039 RepID=A0ABS7FXH0_9ACTN|nr:hypothetical protein [Actinomadura parmotrematis]MBW8485119.1 hypothetical protein [Actinomadura parmotrematis]